MESGTIHNRTIPKKFLRLVPVRDAYILQLCANKNVLHIGASDWPYTQEKYERGCLLYSNIGKVAKEQLGIDADEESSKFLNDMHIKNSRVMVRDMNELQEVNFVPDVIIFGETLEHLMNLETALSSMKRVMQKDTTLLISVPNAFYFMNFVYAMFRKEQQHPDHSVAFTYKTLTQLLKKNDLHTIDFAFTFLESSSQRAYLNWKGKMMHALVRLFARVSPLFAETLVVVARR